MRRTVCSPANGLFRAAVFSAAWFRVVPFGREGVARSALSAAVSAGRYRWGGASCFSACNGFRSKADGRQGLFGPFNSMGAAFCRVCRSLGGGYFSGTTLNSSLSKIKRKKFMGNSRSS